MLRTYLPNKETDFQDFQDFPLAPARGGHRGRTHLLHRKPLITPMSFLREDYTKEIFTAITAHGVIIHT